LDQCAYTAIVATTTDCSDAVAIPATEHVRNSAITNVNNPRRHFMALPKYTLRYALLAAVALAAAAPDAHAFGDACKSVNLSVDNENDYGVVVTNFEFWSQSEGRWLNEQFSNISVPGGAKDFVVARNQNIEHAENDKITQIRVHYEYQWVSRESANEIPPKIDTAKLISTDTTITDPVCLAGRWYKATIIAKPRLGT
jgi:hypothetical protein